MGIYRDWIMKQKTEEGINRQEKINEKDIEAEACIELGTRCSIRLNPGARNERSEETEEVFTGMNTGNMRSIQHRK